MDEDTGTGTLLSRGMYDSNSADIAIGPNPTVNTDTVSVSSLLLAGGGGDGGDYSNMPLSMSMRTPTPSLFGEKNALLMDGHAGTVTLLSGGMYASIHPHHRHSISLIAFGQ